jgi:DNA mismatch endonuclease (patch repair protein)
MSRIRGKDTAPELMLRRALFRLGLRYVLHDRRLPGRPDLVFPRHRAVIFVHGCFWHRHGCGAFRWPATRRAYWRAKIMGNVTRDETALSALNADGWRVLVLWECAMRAARKDPSRLAARAAAFVRGRRRFLELPR